MIAGLAALMAPLASGIGFILSPILRRNRGNSRDDFVPLAISPDALPADGTPVRVSVLADRQDAWNHYPVERIGAVWLRRATDGSIQAFSTICPHLGCAVDFRGPSRDFFCPCHTSTFDLEGRRLNRIPPRDMDTLEVRIDQQRIHVRYLRFRAGTPEKVRV
jgi:Rieske Fe-S protein